MWEREGKGMRKEGKDRGKDGGKEVKGRGK